VFDIVCGLYICIYIYIFLICSSRGSVLSSISKIGKFFDHLRNVTNYDHKNSTPLCLKAITHLCMKYFSTAKHCLYRTLVYSDDTSFC
jgi:hypothetical protein